MTIRYMHLIFRFALLFLWGPAFAAGLAASVPTSILHIEPVIMILTGVFSTLAGLTTLAIRINKELDTLGGKSLPRPGLYCAAHMLGSWLAGAFAFIMGQHYAIDVWLGFAGVLIFSFSGATALEKVANKWLGVYPVPPTTTVMMDTKTHAILTVPAELRTQDGKQTQ